MKVDLHTPSWIIAAHWLMGHLLNYRLTKACVQTFATKLTFINCCYLVRLGVQLLVCLPENTKLDISDHEI